MEQICNLVYHTLAENRTTVQLAELDVLLSDPKDKERMLERQNATAMDALMSMGDVGMVGPRPPRPPA